MATNLAPTFSPTSGGWVTTAFNGGLTASVVQPDGKVLAAAIDSDANGTHGYALMRYNSDGSADTGFGTSGVAIIDIAGRRVESATDIVVLADGKFLVGGSSSPETAYTSDFTLTRFNADGSLDTTFGTGGTVVTHYGYYDNGTSLVVQADGRIVLAGSTSTSGANWPVDFMIARYNADGSADTSFNGTGTVVTNMGGSYDFLVTANALPGGKLLVVGNTDSGGYSPNAPVTHLLGMAVYNADGSLDTSFNGTGKLNLNVNGGSFFTANDATIDANGKIIVSGYNGTPDMVLLRFNADGSADTTFNTTGRVTTDFGGGTYDDGGFVAVQADGKVLLAGRTETGGNYNITLARYNVDGSLDTTFNGTGKVVTDVGGQDGASDVLVQADGKIVIAGEGASHGVLVRYNADGTLDTTYAVSPHPSLGGSATYIEGDPPVVLDAMVAVLDSELAALAGGAGDYGGASVTLARVGAASADDVFSGTGSLALAAGTATLGGQAIGTYTQAAGSFTLTFAAGTTQAHVNDALSSIGYANVSDAPPTDPVQIGWTFSDGNTGTQGTGGALAGSGATSVTIYNTNDEPTGTVTVSGPAIVGQTLTASNDIVDPDGAGTSGIGYQWQSDGADIADATGATFTLGSAQLGHTVSVVATYVDGGWNYESVASAATAPVGAGDTTAPTITAFQPADEATAVPVGTNIGVTFSESVVRGSGVVELRTAAGALVESFDAAASTRLVVAGATVTIDPTADLAAGTEYAVTFAAGAFKDAAGNAMAASSGYNFLTAGGQTINGTAGNDNLVGTAGSDTLNGGAGADTLNGMAGADTLVGGDGADTYVVDNAGDIVVETATKASGVDLVQASVSYSLAANVENLTLTGTAAINGTGNALDNTITGNTADNVLDGGAGRDTLAGGLGNDTYVVDTAKDVLVETAAAGTDTVVASVDWILAANFEQLTLTGSAVVAIGNDAANVLTGDAVNNVLGGGLGADILTGSGGADVFGYLTTPESTTGAMDVITDFHHAEGDRIDLSRVDANTAQKNQQHFTFIGTAAFGADATGQLRFDAATNTLLGSTNADGTAEFAVKLAGVTGLVAADLVL